MNDWAKVDIPLRNESSAFDVIDLAMAARFRPVAGHVRIVATEPNETGVTTYYFNPEAARLLAAELAQWRAVPCSAPSNPHRLAIMFDAEWPARSRG